ncbi:hypothetical protein C0J52_22083 [Blattella germanica]|nr:hypothetical protein C0J52_22083 [Blattella germanica]
MENLVNHPILRLIYIYSLNKINNKLWYIKIRYCHEQHERCYRHCQYGRANNYNFIRYLTVPFGSIRPLNKRDLQQAIFGLSF